MPMLLITFVVIGSLAILLLVVRVLLALFGPALPYRTEGFAAGELRSDDYVAFLGAISDAPIHRRTTISVLKNGEEIYSAELAAINSAQHSVNLESYEFIEGRSHAPLRRSDDRSRPCGGASEGCYRRHGQFRHSRQLSNRPGTF